MKINIDSVIKAQLNKMYLNKKQMHLKFINW